MLPLVRRIALKFREYLPAHVESDDLTADGVVGLVDAVAKFDPNKRVKLESYAGHRVRGAILDGLRAADPASRDLRRKCKRFQKLYRRLEVKVQRPVHDEEIAWAAGINLTKWQRALNEIQSVGLDCGSRFLSASPTSTPQSTDPELLIDRSDNPFDLYYRREQREILGRAISQLCERERQIISLRYESDMTMKQIADLMHVDASRISQLHARAMLRLKASLDFLLQPQSAGVTESVSRLMLGRAKA
jgi:RNA polymerase sigma factor for flagellar operon FliA